MRRLVALLAVFLVILLAGCDTVSAPVDNPNPNQEEMGTDAEYHYIVDESSWYHDLKIEVLEAVLKRDQITFYVYVENTGIYPARINVNSGYAMIDGEPFDVDMVMMSGPFDEDIPPGYRGMGWISLVDLDMEGEENEGAGFDPNKSQEVVAWIGIMRQQYKEEPLEVGFNLAIQ